MHFLVGKSHNFSRYWVKDQPPAPQDVIPGNNHGMVAVPIADRRYHRAPGGKKAMQIIGAANARFRHAEDPDVEITPELGARPSCHGSVMVADQGVEVALVSARILPAVEHPAGCPPAGFSTLGEQWNVAMDQRWLPLHRKDGYPVRDMDAVTWGDSIGVGPLVAKRFIAGRQIDVLPVADAVAPGDAGKRILSGNDVFGHGVHLSSFGQGIKKHDGTGCAENSWQQRHPLHRARQPMQQPGTSR
jgi:hypothetical protein